MRVVSIIHGKENIKSDFFNLELPARKTEFEEVKIKTQIDFLIWILFNSIIIWKRLKVTFSDSTDEYFAPNAFCCHKWSLRQGKISNIEDEQYFFCHKSLIIVCIRLDETYISSIVA